MDPKIKAIYGGILHGQHKEAGLTCRPPWNPGRTPMAEAFARQIGADGYAPDASRAVSLAKSFLF